MRQQMMASVLAVAMAMGAAPVWSQTGVINYEDISKRKTRSTEREDRKKREAEEAKKKAEEEKRRDERRKRYEAANNRNQNNPGKPDGDKKDDTTGTKAAAGQRAPRPVGARSPGTTGGSSDPTTQEVNEVILNAVKTRTVHFDPEKAESNPNLIILNEPKHQLKSRIRAGDTGMGEAL